MAPAAHEATRVLVLAAPAHALPYREMEMDSGGSGTVPTMSSPSPAPPEITAQLPICLPAASSANSSKPKPVPRPLTGGRQRGRLSSLQQGRGHGDSPWAAPAVGAVLLWGDRRSGPVGWQLWRGRPRTHPQEGPAGRQLGNRVRVGTVPAQQLLEGADGLGVALGRGEELSSAACTAPPASLGPQPTPQPPCTPRPAPLTPHGCCPAHPSAIPAAPAAPCPCGRGLWATQAVAAEPPSHPRAPPHSAAASRSSRSGSQRACGDRGVSASRSQDAQPLGTLPSPAAHRCSWGFSRTASLNAVTASANRPCCAASVPRAGGTTLPAAEPPARPGSRAAAPVRSGDTGVCWGQAEGSRAAKLTAAPPSPPRGKGTSGTARGHHGR